MLDEDKAKITDLAFKVMDDIEEEYGDDVKLNDCIIVFEVEYPDPDAVDEADTIEEGNWRSTTSRGSINVGMLRLALQHMETVSGR